MELPKKTSSESVIRRKRPVDNSNDCKLEEFRKCTQVVRDYPVNNSYDCKPEEVRKRRTLAQVVRDFPLDNVESDHGDDNLVDSQRHELNRNKPKEYGRNKPPTGSRPAGKVRFWDPNEGDAQKPEVTTTIVTRRNPLKNLDNVDSNVGKDESVYFKPFENNKLKCAKPTEVGSNTPSFGSRPTSKVKFWDPNGSKQGATQKPNDTVTVVSHKEQIKRERIVEAMTIFSQVNESLYQDNRLKPKGEKIAHWRVPVKAAKMVKERLKWMDPEKIVGPICGVQIGDKFKYRSQLQMVGLHCQAQSGIDYTKIQGKKIAISIVDSHRYSNESGSCNMLIYCGQGGHGFLNGKPQREDQKLERGNLALKNSMDEKTPVRVIRKVYGLQNNGVFVYDGLYIVNRYTQMRSARGNIVFKFQLNRVPGQHQLHKMLNGSSW